MQHINKTKEKMKKEKLESVKEYMSELGRRSWAVRKERHGKKLVELLSKAGKRGGKMKGKVMHKQAV